VFDACEICGVSDWQTVHTGPVREGAFGSLTVPETVVGRCGGCGAERLAEAFCHDDSIYTGHEYRSLLQEGTDAASFFAEHDMMQLQNLTALWPESVRGKRVADVGCAAGSFLDHISGLAAETIAIEPCHAYHDSLRERGHTLYATASEGCTALAASVNFATTFSVIEHVRNPRAFLTEIASLLKPGGRMLVSTPNRRDVLMDLLPDDYPAFFYRSVHRWYFDVSSFTRCAELAGLCVEKSVVVHRFGLSNALVWLRDRKPGGRTPLPHLDSPLLDSFWQSYIEQEGSGDYLYFSLARAG
jgi:2-polyprenyl-3-methyl-5-hydroxy-6-metoxy-1,4-benzoquinol methylase